MGDEDLVESEGWKGKSETETIEEVDCWILREWRKHKHTGEHYFEEHKVPKKNVEILQNIIEQCRPREEYGAYFLWRKLIQEYKLAQIEGMEEETILQFFNGSKFRTKYYFPLYYRPMKILEDLGVIWYGGNTRTWMRLE